MNMAQAKLFIIFSAVVMLLAGQTSAQNTNNTYQQYIPHIPGSAAWVNSLHVYNPGSQPASFRLNLFSQGTAVYSNTVQVAPLSDQTLSLSDLAPLATTGMVTGSNPPPEFRLGFQSISGGGIAEFTLPDTPQAALGFYFGTDVPSVTWKGIAVMNTGAAPENVTLYALGTNAVLGAVNDTIPPRDRLSGTHKRWFPTTPVSEIASMVVVGARNNLVGITIIGNADNSQLLSSPAVPITVSGPPNPNVNYVVFAWNDLGMHCLNPTYDKAVILPPYNTVWAQVIQKGNPPQIITQGISVDYRILTNTFSYGKADYGQFWDYCQTLFGTSLAPDTGLNLKNPSLHNGLAGVMQPVGDHFEAVGIPVTPLQDDWVYDPYQIAEITVRDSAGTIIAQTRATVPVSDQINCAQCHGADPFQDILVKHPQVNGSSLASQAPVLCARCHASPALGSAPGDRGMAGTYLSEAIHGFHADKAAACYDCHPGITTRCNRSIAHDSGDGNCQTCHGTMAQMAQQIATNVKVPWVTEPACALCHAATGVNTGATLYRDSAGHGGVYCAACHQSPHAMVPSREASDNYQALYYQGAALSIGSCGACHRSSRGPAEDEFDEFAEAHGSLNPERKNACHVCHTAVSANTAAWPHSFTWTAR